MGHEDRIAPEFGEGTPVQRTTPRSRLQKHRRLVLVTVSLVFSALVLTLLEVGLRLAGYGGYPPTFRPAGTLVDGSTLVFTDHGGPTSYFFSNRSLPGSLDPSAFVMPKPADTVRIFIVGESAAKGNPYPRPLSAGSFLRAMLADLWPDRKVEVINLGVTAIASFPALGLLTECLDYQPDVVVAYLGNNEFYGAYGVASLHSAGRSAAMIRLIRATRSLAIAQFIDAQRAGLKQDDPRTLMEAMVGQSFIAPDDPARAAAARNLETFVGDMIDRCHARSVPIIVCTPPANERDLAPLGEPDLSALSATDRQAIDATLGRARERLAEDPHGAADLLRNVVHMASNHATAHYLLGRALHAQGQFQEAAAEFRTALNLDPMPWRPPHSSVEAIRRAVDSRGAILCDLEREFREASPGGSIGWELMDDHVHPSLQGQDLIARTVAPAIAQALAGIDGTLAVSAAKLGGLPDWNAYAHRLGVNPYDLYAASHAMRLIASIPFFKRTNPQFFEHHEAICRQIEQASPPAAAEQLQRWKDPAKHAGNDRPLTGMVAVALMQAGAVAEAGALFRIAAETAPPYGSWNLEYVYKALVCRLGSGQQLSDADREAAKQAIERGTFLVKEARSDARGANLWVGMLHQLLGEMRESVPYLMAVRDALNPADRVTVDESLVRAYVAIGQPEKARAIVDDGLRGPYPDPYRAMHPN